MDNRGEVWKALIVITPCLAATLIAVSRIMDARHHPFDVITGSLLGVVCAYISYHQYFPPLRQPWKKGRAFPIRTWGAEPASPKFVGGSESTAALRNPEEERFDPPPPMPENRAPADHRLSRNETYTSATGNPYVPGAYGRRPHDDDGNWSSSSEDVADGYEMQHGYAQAQNPAFNAPRYYEETAYQSQTAPDAGFRAPPAVMTSRTGPGRELTDLPPREV